MSTFSIVFAINCDSVVLQPVAHHLLHCVFLTFIFRPAFARRNRGEGEVPPGDIYRAIARQSYRAGEDMEEGEEKGKKGGKNGKEERGGGKEEIEEEKEGGSARSHM